MECTLFLSRQQQPSTVSTAKEHAMTCAIHAMSMRPYRRCADCMYRTSTECPHSADAAEVAALACPFIVASSYRHPVCKPCWRKHGGPDSWTRTYGWVVHMCCLRVYASVLTSRVPPRATPVVLQYAGAGGQIGGKYDRTKAFAVPVDCRFS